MLTFFGAPRRFCDRINRRDFLQLGALGLGGLTLADVLRLRAQAGAATTSPRAVIMVCLSGGPSHIDMYDLKPDAPVEYRGDFRPIRTNVPGFDITELMPLQARIADRLALVRTVQFFEPMQHELPEVYTGYPKAAHRPSFGSVISRFRGGDPTVPRYVSLDQYNADHAEVENPRYVGASHRPILLGGDGVRNLSLNQAISMDRLRDRRQLQTTFDTLRRDIDARQEFAAADAFSEQALQIITSPRAREAFDLSRESVRTREMYGSREDKYIYGNDPIATNPWPGDKFLLARRLVEAGVSVVTLRVGTWDYHGTSSGTGNIFTGLRSQLPLLDRSIHALVSDLHQRGLDRDVLVLVWGEFGRTPRINNVEGRDHWPPCGYALFAGGGLKTGQVVGETDSKAEQPRSRPVNAQNVLATVYTALGIDPTQQLPDFTGRPRPLLDDGAPIHELL